MSWIRIAGVVALSMTLLLGVAVSCGDDAPDGNNNNDNHTSIRGGHSHLSGAASTCNVCHRPNNTGGLGPACSLCH